MRKILLPGAMAVCLVFMSSTNQATAQEEEATSVHITIKEDGKVTTDTTFELKEGQDSDLVEKMVQHMVEGDEKMMKKEVIMMQKGDDDCEHKELGVDEDHEMHFKHEGHGDHEIMIIESDEDMEWTEEDGEKVDVYVIKKGDKDVKVVKKVTIEVEDESEKGVEKEVEVEIKTEKKKKEKKEK